MAVPLKLLTNESGELSVCTPNSTALARASIIKQESTNNLEICQILGQN